MDFLTPGYEDLELSTQLVIKEAEARGARVEVIDRADNFIVIERGERREYVKQATRTSADSYIAALAMENKHVSKLILSRAGVRAPEGFLRFDVGASLEAAAAFAGREFVIKPRSTNFGEGVAMLGRDWTTADARAAIEAALALDDAVVIEEFAAGREFRFLVIGGETRAVLHRVPANVVGDGSSTIARLVAIKNEDPLRGEGYHTPLERIRLGEVELGFLGESGRDTNAIPQEGERVFLRKNSNISTGGDSIDLTDEMPAVYKRVAERAADAIGAKVSGIDMIIPDIGDSSDAAAYSVLELNYNPALHIHDYPAVGKNRRVEGFLLDLIGFDKGGRA